MYQVWDTDSSGNYVSAPLSDVSGTSPALVSMETSFNDDLNNDGVIGTPPPQTSQSSLIKARTPTAHNCMMSLGTTKARIRSPYECWFLNIHRPTTRIASSTRCRSNPGSPGKRWVTV